MPAPSRPRSRIRRALLLAFFAVAPATLVATAPLTIRGRTFGRLIEHALPAIRGRAHVGGGRWSWKTLWALAHERPAALELEDVSLVDPDGVAVLGIGTLTARLELHRSTRTVIVRDVRADRVFFRLDEDPTGAVRLSNALAGPPGIAARGGDGSGAFTLLVPNAVLDRLDARFDLPSWGLDVENVRGLTAALSYEGGGANRLSFGVSGAEVRGGGAMRVGPRDDAWLLPFERARIDRVSTIDGEPDALGIAARDIEAGRSELAVSGDFRGVFGAPAAPAVSGLSLTVTGSRAADAVRAIVARRALSHPVTIGGPEAAFEARVDGPYERLAVTADASALALDVGAVHVSSLGFRLTGEPATGRLRLARFSGDWRGVGRIAGALSLEARADGVELRRLALTLTRPVATRGPRVIGVGARTRTPQAKSMTSVAVDDLRVDGGSLRVPGLELPLWGGTLAARGTIAFRDPKTARALAAPLVDVSFSARRLDLDEALGSTFLAGKVSCRGRVRGPLWGPVFDVSFPRDEVITLFGEPLRLPRRTTFLFTQGAVYLHLDVAGQRGVTVVASGTVDLTGRLNLELDTRNFPLARLPAVADAGLDLFGELSGKLRVSGTTDAPAIAGGLWLFPVGLQGRETGRGSLELTSERAGTLHARGRLMNGVDVDGTLATRGRGHRGQIALRLDHLIVEPVLPAAPGDVRMRGVVSGDVVVRVAPGTHAALEGALSDLTLDVSRASGPPVRLHAAGPIAVSAKADGTKALGPAHFAGAVGLLDVEARSAGEAFHATAKGRVDLATLAPLAAPLLVHAAGTLAVDLAATWRGAGGRLALDGEVVVAKPVSARLTPFAATVSIPAGRGRFVDGAFDTRGLAVVVAADFPSASLVSHGEGALVVDAHVPASGSPITVGLESRTLLLQIPLVGEMPVATGGGKVRLEGDLGALAAFDETALREIDLPLRGVARHMTVPSGKIDHATFDLRLTGIPRRTLTLSGDVEVLGARVRSDGTDSMTAKTDAHADDAPATLRNPRLDLRVRARDGAVTVELPNAPDVHLDVDARARGTLSRPVVTAEAKPAGVYSAILMALRGLLQ